MSLIKALNPDRDSHAGVQQFRGIKFHGLRSSGKPYPKGFLTFRKAPMVRFRLGFQVGNSFITFQEPFFNPG
jgi:hypothetical protein